MDIRHKFYPYPVLDNDSDDYVDSSFNVDIVAKEDGNNIIINFIAGLNNDEMNKLIAKEALKFVYHIECAQTGYREVVATSNSSISHLLLKEKVCGRVQICPFIVAMENISKYTNNKFNNDYNMYNFDIEVGCIMAVGEQENLDIERDLYANLNLPSVFTIIKNDNNAAKEMVVDMDSNKIVVKISEEEYYNYKSIQSAYTIRPVLNSLIIVPALIYVLEELSKRNASDRYEYSEYVWYRTVKKTLKQKFKIDIEDEQEDQLTNQNMLELSQKIINIPLSDALNMLSGVMKEDDEGELL